MVEATMGSELLDGELEVRLGDVSALFDPLMGDGSHGDGGVSGPANSKEKGIVWGRRRRRRNL